MRAQHTNRMDLTFSGELWYWRGPAPWYFVTVPEPQCTELQDAAPSVSYGWGMIPVQVRIGDSRWSTSLWPKDGRYIVGVKADIRRAEHIDDGDTVSVSLSIGA